MPDPTASGADDAAVVRRILASPDLLTAAHCRIEDFLIEMRDSRCGVLGHANGFVVNEFDGTPSSIMRLGTRGGIKMALEAIADALEAAGSTNA